MIRFLLVYLSVYPLVHYYAFRKVSRAFLLSKKARAGLILFMAIMIAAPIMIRIAEETALK